MMPKSVCIVMYGGPFDIVSHRLYQRLKILSSLVSQVYLIIEGMPKLNDIPPNIIIYDISSPKRFFSYIKAIFTLAKVCKQSDVVIFITGFPKIVTFVMQARLAKKKVISFAGGTAYKVFKARNPNSRIISKIVYILESLCFWLSDLILVENYESTRFLGLDKYISKIFPLGTLVYLNESFFKKYKKPSLRENIVGYIGRIEPEKNVISIIKSALHTIKKIRDIQFIIYGSGSQRDYLVNYVDTHSLEQYVKIMDWIPYEKVPEVLQNLKVLIHPSHTEGLPLTVLEAMSKGTIVITTPVGGLPEIIKDGSTGFIVRSGSPRDIANKLIDVLNLPPDELDRISKNAYVLVKSKYSLKKGISLWKKMLENLMGENA
ncbi:glycosyltransferase family 4 protein [Thermococcus paralvinellae]|uniref:Glycosyl transferase family protein 12 n=1 Tax=Thermococcus paralvinellae TaxID=582419 RepID=W0I9I3_9EURY|nr:glycosyltransferase family 4 protein [Thermococcus paralvinellae]AHF81407.1 glycosyl transferase family protein 12 [Thermococcus paralvinellae]